MLSQVPDLDDRLAGQLVATVGRLRDLELKKAPSIAESVDWARTLVALQIERPRRGGRRPDPRRRAQARLRPGQGRARAQAAELSSMSGLVDRHIDFLEALRAAGVPVSLAEDVDAVAALVDAAAGTTARRCGRRTPRRWSSGRRTGRPSTRSSTSTSRRWSASGRREPPTSDDAGRSATTPRRATTAFRERAGRRAGRRRRGGPAPSWPSRRWAGSARCRAAVRGCRGWSAYTALQRVSPDDLVDADRRGPRWTTGGPRTRPTGSRPGRGRHASRRWSRPRPAAGSRRRRGPTTSPTSPSGPASTASTSPPRAAPTSRRCAARSTRWPAGWRPG